MLADLVNGAAPSSEPATSTGLSGLVQGAQARPMSLPAMMNALKAGTLEPPADGAIGGVMSPSVPPRPAPPPPRLSYQNEIDAAAIDARVDRDEMRSRIRAKRDALQATASYSNDPRANIEDFNVGGMRLCADGKNWTNN